MALIPEIREKIDAWFDGDPGRSSAELSRLSGVPYTTTRRVIQGESLPTCGSLANILSVIFQPEERFAIGELLKLQYPDEALLLDPLVEKGILSDGKRRSLNNLINSDPITSVIYALTESEDGVSAKHIESEYGRNGLQAMRALEKAELIECDDKCYRMTSKKNVNFTPETFKKSFLAHAEYMMMDNLEHDRGVGNITWGYLSEEGYYKACLISKKYILEMSELVKTHKGKIPAYSLSVINSYSEIDGPILSKEQK